jgi:signal transduction histidine kinase
VVSRNTLRFVLFAGALLVLTTAFFGYQLAKGYDQQLKQAEHDTERLVKAIDEHTAMAFDAVDGLLLSVKDQVEALGTELKGGDAMDDLLRRETTRLPQVNALAIYDRSGEKLAASTGAVADLDLLRVNSRAGNPDSDLDIEVAVHPKSGRGFISVSRRLEKADGQAGLVVAWIDAPFFEAFYGALNIGGSGVVALSTIDGTLLVRVPEPANGFYGSLAKAPLAEHLPVSPVGSFRGIYRDQVERITSYRKLRHWPLVVSIGVAVDDALDDWFDLLKTYVLAWLLLSLGIAGTAGGMVIRASRFEQREQRARDERKAAEERAVMAEQRLRDAISVLPDGFVLWSPDDRLVGFNQAAVQNSPGLEQSLRIGARFEDILRDRVYRGAMPAAIGREEEFIAERLARHRVADGEPHEQYYADGRWVRFSERRTPQGDIASLRRNITLDKHLIAEARSAREAAEHANRVKAEFLAHMSHELRTPLNAVIGFSELLRSEGTRTAPEETRAEWLKAIHDSGVHLLALINDVLDYAKVDAGEAVLDEDTVDLAATLASCMNMLKERAAKARVSLTRSVDPEIGPILADQRKLKQIVINLVTNAIKYNREGGSVDVSARPTPDGLLIEVRDTGNGIPADALGLVLEPFRQVDNAYNRKNEGTGLGLPLTKRLVELHGGRLTIDSTVDVGTTVSVLLPRRRVVSAAAWASAPRQPQPSERRELDRDVVEVDAEAEAEQVDLDALVERHQHAGEAEQRELVAAAAGGRREDASVREEVLADGVVR